MHAHHRGHRDGGAAGRGRARGVEPRPRRRPRAARAAPRDAQGRGDELMTSTADEPGLTARSDAARDFLDCLAVQDFERLASTFADDVHLRALLPAELREWDGPERVAATFGRWFGNTQEYQLVGTSIDEIGSRL